MEETKYYRTVKTKDRLPDTEIPVWVKDRDYSNLYQLSYTQDQEKSWKHIIEYWLEEFEMPKMTK